MNLSLINPYIRLSMPSVISAGHTITRRVIYDYELIFLERGEFSFIYNDKKYLCRDGDIIFICPGVPHSFEIENREISQPHIHFDITHRPHSDKIPISFKDICDMTETEKSYIHKNYFESYTNSPIMKITDKESFLDIFYQIISAKTDSLCKKAGMIQLISMLIKDNFKDSVKEQEYADVAHRLKDYIDAGNGLSMHLEEFADFFFQSKFHLEKKFKKAFGVGIIEYRNKKRMEFAPCLLKSNSASRVAEILGYQSIYSFSRAYKQFYGASPRNHILS